MELLTIKRKELKKMKLPKELEVYLRDLDEDLAEQLNEAINDYLSERFGYCVESYGCIIKVKNIEWDEEE